MQNLARVTLVTVTWHSRAAIERLLRVCPPGLAVVVVDNASRDGTAQAARAVKPDAQIIENEENFGFGGGCNRGLEAVRTEFALLANPDIHPSAAAIEALVAAADAFPESRLVAPLLRDAAGQRVRSWNVAQPLRRHLPRRREAEPWPEGPLCVAYASGACLLLRPAEGLRFDESFFLFYEDDDLCARAGGALLVPAADVAHEGGASSAPGAAIRWRKARHMAWSRLSFAALHGGGEAAARRDAARRLIHHAGKALGHAATLRGGKALADLGGLAGTLAWLAGRR